MKHLRGSDKYRVSEELERVVEGSNDIDRANSAIPILKLLWAAGCDIPSEVEKSWKFKCPYAYEHSDQGKGKSARYYPDTNSAFCFDGHDALTPVKMVANRENLTYQEAAEYILNEQGLLKPPQTYQERFAGLLASTSTHTTVYDTSYAVQVLRSWLQDQETYTRRQYDVDIREAFVYSVTVLQEMAEPTPEKQVKWLELAKQVMTKALEKGE